MCCVIPACNRSAGSRLSSAAHRLSVGVVGLATALDQGTPFDQELQLMHAAAESAGSGAILPAAAASEDDAGVVMDAGGGVESVVASVLATLPPHSAAKGLPTLSDLEARCVLQS